MHPLRSHQRQVHLDFHTSPFIPDVGSEFDAAAFAGTVKAAHVNSITVFAKCHHGMCYYPTRTGAAHPALKGRDLLGEQIEALHLVGIRCPVYTTVAWEEDVAQKHPEWRQMKKDGTFARMGNPDWSKPPQPGGWRFNNHLHPDYQDYIEAHVREIFERYEVDGLFFDIVAFESQSCWSEPCVRFREKHGLVGDGLEVQRRFQMLSQLAFVDRFTRLVRGLNPDATIFYNAPSPICADSRYNMRTRHALQTHWELESLPSGFWGYFHLPRLARTCGAWDKPWLGMTGRFQRMWGDFGGLKPQPALEYECFRSQALGGANSIGDQLPPRGTLDAGAYELIGAVFGQCAQAEEFYAGSTNLPQVGILAPGNTTLDEVPSDLALEAAIQMCDEAHYDSVVLDDMSDLAELELIILPDSVCVTPALGAKLAAYLNAGGKLILSHRSGFAANGAGAFDGFALRRTGVAKKFPTYWRTHADFQPALSRSDRVVYLQGDEVEAPECAVLVERVLPYFNRTDLHFSSHFQAPPEARADAYAAVVQGPGFIYFADPIFREYRQSGNIAVRDAWKAAMRRLIGPARFGDGLATTILCTPRRRGDDLLLTLLHYIPTRKSIEIDMIEERSSFAGQVLRLPPRARSARIYGGEELPMAAGGDGFALPASASGRLLLVVPGFFTA